MNICFFSGNIITEPQFKFIINRDISFKKCMHISICYFELRLKGENRVRVKAYDELADLCYKKLKRGDYIVISGEINDLYEVTIDFFQIL